MEWKKRDSFNTVREVFLRNVGAKSYEEVKGWFTKDYHIKGLEEAAKLILTFKDKRVTIVGDYDCDGQASTSILYMLLKSLSFNGLHIRIPHRFSEGYGISEKIVEEIPEGLVITVDNGIAQLAPITKAKEKGLTVIVLDHHLPVEADGRKILPKTDVCVDPKAKEESADFSGYCAAGIAYKLAELMTDDKVLLDKFLSLAAIATIADVMELREENFVFVRKYISFLGNDKKSGFMTAGLEALVSKLGLRRQRVTAHDIAFAIAPCLNAASRMSDTGAENGIRLLTYEGDPVKARQLADSLIETNKARKEAKNSAVAIAEEIIENENLQTTVPIVIYSGDIAQGIVGIVAGHLAEKYHVPSIVLTDSPDGLLTGSARSVEGYNVKEQLDHLAEFLEAYGGHTGAAGLSLKKENLKPFTDKIHEISKGFKFSNPTELYYDIEATAEEIPGLLDAVSGYKPYGEGNAEIVFMIKGFPIARNAYGKAAQFMGADERSLKIFSDMSEAVMFGIDDEKKELVRDKIINAQRLPRLDIVGKLTVNCFKDRVTRQVDMLDFKIA